MLMILFELQDGATVVDQMNPISGSIAGTGLFLA